MDPYDFFISTPFFEGRIETTDHDYLVNQVLKRLLTTASLPTPYDNLKDYIYEWVEENINDISEVESYEPRYS